MSSSQIKLPQITQHDWLDPVTIRLHLAVSADIVYFQGHFPQTPILPGVTQIHWAEYFARQWFAEQLPERAAFQRLEAIKFQQVIQPGTPVQLDLTLKAPGKLYFAYTGLGAQYSSGRLVFQTEDDA